MAFEQVGVQFVAQGGDTYIATLTSATKATTGFVSATEQGSGKVSAAGQVMIGALRAVGTIAVQAFEQAGKAAIGFVKDSISIAGDFEQGMKKFQAVAGSAVDTKGLEQFRGLFIQLGKELPVSTSEVEQAAIEMVSGGIDPAIVAGGALRQTLNFAAASGLSLADAAATSAKFLAGWTSSAATTQEKVDFLTMSTDVLTKAAAASSTTAAELRLGLFNVQGAAQALHAPFADVTATLAELAPAFESSAQAGTALNVFMTRLVPNTNPATDAMKALGIITASNQNLFFDAQGAFLGMGNAAQVLKDKMSGLSDEQKISELHTLFGNDAMKVGNLLMQDGAAGIDAMKAKMDAANGVTATATLMHEGYNTALENAKGSVEALQITIGSALLPVLSDLLNNTIAPGINMLTDFASALFGDNDAFLKLSPTMQDLVTTVDMVIMDMQNIIGTFRDAGAGSVEFAQTIGELVGDLGGPGDLIMGIVFAAQDLVTWFEKANVGSASLSNTLNQLNGVWQIALKTITDVGNGYLAIAQAVLPIIQKLWADHGAQITAFLKTTYDTAIQIITLALQLYDAIVPPILNAIAGFFRTHASEVEAVLTGAGQALGAIVTGTMETIKSVFQLALDVIHGDWGAAWGDIQHIGEVQITAIEGAISGFLNMIAGLFGTSMADIGRLWQHNWDMLVQIATKTDWAQVGQDVIAGIIRGVEHAAGDLMDTMRGLADDALQAAKDALGISSPSTAFMPVGQFAVEGIMQGIAGAIPAMTGVIDTMTGAMIAGLTKNHAEMSDEINKMGDQLKAQAAAIASAVQSAIGNAFGATASVDRQKVANLAAVGALDPTRQAGVQSQIDAAEEISRAMNDPVEAAKYFQLRSKQLIELGQLSDQINAATDDKERARLRAQYQLINDAQNAEMKQSDANQATTTNSTKGLIADMQKLLANPNLPGIFESSAIAALNTGFRNLISPPASSAQMANSTTNNTSTTNYTMPIYTNNSPSALQDSMAIAGSMTA